MWLDGPGIKSGGGEIFRTRQDRTWGPPSLLYSGHRVFPGGKAAGAWRWPPSPSRAQVIERVGLYFSPSVPSWPVLGWTLPLPSPLCVIRVVVKFGFRLVINETPYKWWPVFVKELQGGSNMTGTDLCVNKPHCAAAVRPWESEATTSTLPPARVRWVRWRLTCASVCQLWLQKKNQSRSYLNHLVFRTVTGYICFPPTSSLVLKVSAHGKQLNGVLLGNGQ